VNVAKVSEVNDVMFDAPANKAVYLSEAGVPRWAAAHHISNKPFIPYADNTQDIGRVGNYVRKLFLGNGIRFPAASVNGGTTYALAGQLALGFTTLVIPTSSSIYFILPTGVAGDIALVWNSHGSTAAWVFPKSGEYINGGQNKAALLPAGLFTGADVFPTAGVCLLYCYQDSYWVALGK
jgi:hypothetical protein